MTSTHPPPNIWSQMSYTPPRGPCSKNISIVSTCSCHRFMIHPLKASTSFDCDGCGHHASFHALTNPAEERVLERWKGERLDEKKREEEMEADEERRKRREMKMVEWEVGEGDFGRLDAFGDAVTVGGKRRRMIAAVPGEGEVVDLVGGGGAMETRAVGGRKRKGRG